MDFEKFDKNEIFIYSVVQIVQGKMSMRTFMLFHLTNVEMKLNEWSISKRVGKMQLVHVKCLSLMKFYVVMFLAF